MLFTMHAHNLWSQWLYSVLGACDTLGLTVAHYNYRNQSGDGSTSTDYYVSSHVLARIGGIVQVKALATERHAEVMERRHRDVD